MDKNAIIRMIEEGRAVVGVELGSTRIKTVMIGEDCAPVASGSFTWENRLENGIWTYHQDEIWTGVQASYADMCAEVKKEYGAEIKKLGALSFSAMMHGYLPFDKDAKLLVPFRTWRNTITEPATKVLTKLFSFNIPQRWSIAHLYQAILNGEEHLPKIDYLTTLAGYVHWQLTGDRVLGIGDASGMFPIDSAKMDYDAKMLDEFDALIANKGYGWKLRDILPKVLSAGEPAGKMTEAGAKLLDPSGVLQAGVPLCPPEGDAGTGMTATNSVRVRTGNVSAGTSIFAMAVLERPLSKVYTEIDMVTTPAGAPVAMVHCNNCSSDVDAWVRLFGEASAALGRKASADELYTTLYSKALEGEADCGGLVNYNYFSGEHITHIEKGRPLFTRGPADAFTLANFMRCQLDSALATLKMGMDILFEKEQVELDELLGHGGYFKTRGVGQRLAAAAMNVPVTVMETAGEGGAWGAALLGAFLINKKKDETLEDHLSDKVFANDPGSTIKPDAGDVEGFEKFMERYKAGLAVEQAAEKAL